MIKHTFEKNLNTPEKTTQRLYHLRENRVRRGLVLEPWQIDTSEPLHRFASVLGEEGIRDAYAVIRMQSGETSRHQVIR